GIRDFHVTGVQTCALPISSPSIFSRKLQTSLSLSDGESTLLGGLISRSRNVGKTKVPVLGDIPILGAAFQSRRAESTRTEMLMRSEERRVGKECSSRWWEV